MNWIDTMHAQYSAKSSQLTPALLVMRLLNVTKRVIVSMVHGILNWQRDQIERAQLRGMNEHMLKDLGITRGQADQMAREPWHHRDLRKSR